MNEWFAAACNLYNVEDGNQLFLQLSRQSKGYVSDEDCMKTFKSCKKYADEEDVTLMYWIGKARKYLGADWFKDIMEHPLMESNSDEETVK